MENKKTTTFGLGDLQNGIFERFDTELLARKAFDDAVTEGTLSNLECLGELGCTWADEDACRQAAADFFYVVKIEGEGETETVI